MLFDVNGMTGIITLYLKIKAWISTWIHKNVSNTAIMNLGETKEIVKAMKIISYLK